jgi:hypothetical protein
MKRSWLTDAEFDELQAFRRREYDSLTKEEKKRFLELRDRLHHMSGSRRNPSPEAEK